MDLPSASRRLFMKRNLVNSIFKYSSVDAKGVVFVHGTKRLAQFARDLSYSDLSPQVIEIGKMCVEDLIGVALAGSVTPHGRIWRSYFACDGQPAEASAWEQGFPRMAYRQAAALNAAYGHLLDMDDVHNSSIVHLGIITIPAALAIGSHRHCSGRELLAAIAAGYEVGARVGEAINPSSYYYWHTTGVVGALSTAAAAGKLLGLNEEQYLNAFGSAGTQSAGLWEFLADGAMSKALHTVNATLCGIRSAELAALGVTGAQDILTGKRGLLRALAPDYDQEALTRELDYGRLKLLGNSFKPYACCRHTHSANYAVEKIKLRHELRPENISHITDKTYAVARQTVDCPDPTTPYACKFSAQYCIAAMLLYGNLMEEVFTEPNVSNPWIRQLMEKITVEQDAQLEAEHQADTNSWPHLLEITLHSGEVITEKVCYPLGDARNPFDWAMTDRKFNTLTDGILTIEQAESLCGAIQHLEELDDVSLLFEPKLSLVSGGPPY